MNTSRKILKSDGTQIDADYINTFEEYEIGTYQSFTATMSNDNSLVMSKDTRVYYPVRIKRNCNIDQVLFRVITNGTPTAGAKISVGLFRLTNQTTMQVVENLAEFDATNTTLQTASVSKIIPSGLLWLGVCHNNNANITVFGSNLVSVENVQTVSGVMSNNLLKQDTNVYAYPLTVGSSVTVSNTSGLTAIPISKFRIA